MARPQRRAAAPKTVMTRVSGNVPDVIAGSVSVYQQHKRPTRTQDDRRTIAQPWQIECYRHVNICGEARKGVTLYAALAARAEIGISEPQALGRKAVWADPVEAAEEIAVLAEIAPTVRERKTLVRNYMTHRIIAGECYLIARSRREQDPGYLDHRRNEPIWEIVAVTELRRRGDTWQVRLDNNDYVDLSDSDPIIRMWVPNPEDRREAWSPMRALLPVLREIEWATGHIFTQIRSRLMSAGVWFLPDNLTFPAPPPDAVEGGAEAIAAMNEAERFMVALAASGSYELDLDDVSFPTVVMGDAAALEGIDQDKLIKFWSDIDDKVMTLRDNDIRRLALGWDLTPEQLLGSSGVAVSGSGGSAGSVNHWGEWANEEKTIAGHIEPALDDFTAVFTESVLRLAVPTTQRVVGYDPASIRMKQDRSKEALQLNERGLLSGEVTLRETGFDPEFDMMGDEEFKRFLLMKFVNGSPTPEMMIEALRLLGQAFPDVEVPAVSGNPAQEGAPKEVPGRHNAPSTKEILPKGPPRGDHEHKPAPYATAHAALLAASEVLVLRALEKAGNRLLNDGKRGRDKDRKTPAHLAHMVASAEAREEIPEFDFSLLPVTLSDIPITRQVRIGGALVRFCTRLYVDGDAYTRQGLIEALEGL